MDERGTTFPETALMAALFILAGIFGAGNMGYQACETYLTTATAIWGGGTDESRVAMPTSVQCVPLVPFGLSTQDPDSYDSAP